MWDFKQLTIKHWLHSLIYPPPFLHLHSVLPFLLLDLLHLSPSFLCPIFLPLITKGLATLTWHPPSSLFFSSRFLSARLKGSCVSSPAEARLPLVCASPLLSEHDKELHRQLVSLINILYGTHLGGLRRDSSSNQAVDQWFHGWLTLPPSTMQWTDCNCFAMHSHIKDT